MEWDEEKSALFFLLKWMIANELHNLTSPLFLNSLKGVRACVVCVYVYVHVGKCV